MMKKLLSALAAVLVSGVVAVAATNLSIDGYIRLNAGTATGSAGASTLNNKAGVITTESLTSAAGVLYTETITNSAVAAGDLCFASVSTAGTGTPAVAHVTPAAGSLVVKVQNIHASAAFNNTLAITFNCSKP